MPILESEYMLWGIGFLLMALVYPIWFVLLIVKAEKDPQVDVEELARKESGS
ncbi:hypothetical protein HS1genome_0598 [Sulfodiicoccus acidiphilus]|uniref:Uncharacterized protein n=1 Tax=Sulfodiicoccus acidiphilus TaxID=1670455 RepID=A0A348B207_9CREN|nr:hypothetical protein [Sulfodiicoccus acidiphilus]BBD72209.1 hypothetical protein HS1genome_0598 [Sulfodiicoccus acidiphilus]GGU03025.1 hypothetical protein GCM10007116_20050 [Sulfodiicoccus acidiphilus]